MLRVVIITIPGPPSKLSCLAVAPSSLKAEPASQGTTSWNCGNSSLRWVFYSSLQLLHHPLAVGLEAAGGEETVRQVLFWKHQPHLHQNSSGASTENMFCNVMHQTEDSLTVIQIFSDSPVESMLHARSTGDYCHSNMSKKVRVNIYIYYKIRNLKKSNLNYIYTSY